MLLLPFKYFKFLSNYIQIHIKTNKPLSKRSCYKNELTVCTVSPVFQLLMKFFKYSSLFQAVSLVDIVACDYTNVINRFGITYLVYSQAKSARLYIRVCADIFVFLKSLSSLFLAATWLEREVYDMFGLFFFENYDLRRILLDYGFNGFPLQKDFPVVGFVEKQYILSENIILSSPVVFTQEFRFII